MLYTKLEKSMRSLLIDISDNHSVDDLIRNTSFDQRVALHECVSAGYLEGIVEHKNALGDYRFYVQQFAHLTRAGYRFLRDTSPVLKICRFILSIISTIFHGTLGFILGVASTVTAEIITFILRDEGIIESIARRIAELLP